MYKIEKSVAVILSTIAQSMLLKFMPAQKFTFFRFTMTVHCNFETSQRTIYELKVLIVYKFDEIRMNVIANGIPSAENRQTFFHFRQIPEKAIKCCQLAGGLRKRHFEI